MRTVAKHSARTRFGLLSPKLTPKRCRTAREQQLRIDRIGSGGPFWSIPPARIRAQSSHSFLENGFKRMRQRSVPYVMQERRRINQFPLFSRQSGELGQRS